MEGESNKELEKQTRWEALSSEVEKIEDSQGKKVDAGIKEALIVFMAFEFPTSQSCEGHKEHGLAYPWIEIYAPAPEGWQEDDEKKKEWKSENLKQKKRC